MTILVNNTSIIHTKTTHTHTHSTSGTLGCPHGREAVHGDLLCGHYLGMVTERDYNVIMHLHLH